MSSCNFGLVLAVIVFPASTIVAQSATVPRFEPGECVVQMPKGENGRCGHLVVPENRNRRSGRTVRLPIAILRSESREPKPDPVLRTLGGPGGSSLRLVNGRRSSPWLRDRDLIIFEQRGTKYSQPSLACPEVDAANIDSVRQGLARDASRRAELRAAVKCHDRLTRSGIDLSSYNSVESAADIEDLRRVLGIAKINLYGISYSARLMLEVMRRYPTGIRSVVLESTLPPEVNYDEAGVDGIVASLEQMFRSCRADADCNSAYPALQNEFYAVVKRLNRQPLVSEIKEPDGDGEVEVRLTGDDFATWIVDYLFSNEPEATVEAPFVIHEAFKGNYVQQFRQYASDKLNVSSYSLGMRYSVWCVEERPFENRTRIREQSTKHPGLLGYEVMSLPEICGIWKVRPAAAVQNTPVRSDIPTLILAAEYDAYTPPHWSLAVSKRLSKSHFFTIPWAGHGPGFSVPCVRDMIAAFIGDPLVTPDAGCIERTTSQFRFTTKKP